MAANSSAAVDDDPKKKAVPKIVTLDKALKLAETWVNRMSSSTTIEQTDKDVEGRPSRLGLGARFNPKAKAAEPIDPVERKLLKKLNIDKKQFPKKVEKPSPCENNTSSDEDIEEPDSRTSRFSKKRAIPMPALIQLNKRSK